MKKATNIGECLIQRLYAHGVRHVFGIPGDVQGCLCRIAELMKIRLWRGPDQDRTSLASPSKLFPGSIMNLCPSRDEIGA